MPRLIATPPVEPLPLAGLIDALDASGIDFNDEAQLTSLAPLLAALAADRRFLADLVIAELERRCAGQEAGNTYGAQVFILAPANGRYLLRANLWPAAKDAAVRSSGLGAFFYDLPHDHNFPFLTAGYLGPGYESDDYEWDRDSAVGAPGETVALRSLGRTRLGEGQVMLYRAHRDIHVQHPPAALSVSLNILAYDPAQMWREQFRFDVAGGAIASGLTVAPSEALVAIAPHLDPEGAALARSVAAHHPHPRMRATAFAALASAAGPDGWHAVLEAAADDRDAYVAAHARAKLAAIARLHPERSEPVEVGASAI